MENKDNRILDLAISYINKNTGQVFVSIDGDTLVNPSGKCIPNNEDLFKEVPTDSFSLEITQAQKLRLAELFKTECEFEEEEKRMQNESFKIFTIDNRDYHFRKYNP